MLGTTPHLPEWADPDKNRVAKIASYLLGDPRDVGSAIQNMGGTGMLFFSHTPEALTKLATQSTYPTDVRKAAAVVLRILNREWPAHSSMMIPAGTYGTLPEHSIVHMVPFGEAETALGPVKAVGHEVIHALQTALRGKEITPPSPLETVSREISAWAPLVKKEVPGSIKLIQDMIKSGHGLPAYYQRMHVPNPEEVAKHALMRVRSRGFIPSSFPGVEKASKATVTPDMLQKFQQVLEGKLESTGPYDLPFHLSRMEPQAALRRLLSLPPKP